MSEYTGPERRGSGGWHLSKSLSLTHLFSTLAIVVAGFTYMSDLEQDILRNSLAHDALVQTVERNQQWNTTAFGEIKTMLNSISDRLDKLADRR